MCGRRNRLSRGLQPHHLAIKADDATWSCPFVARRSRTLVVHSIHHNVADGIVSVDVASLPELRLAVTPAAIEVDEVQLR